MGKICLRDEKPEINDLLSVKKWVKVNPGREFDEQNRIVAEHAPSLEWEELENQKCQMALVKHWVVRRIGTDHFEFYDHETYDLVGEFNVDAKLKELG